MSKPTFVEMAEIRVSRDRDAVLLTLGLGSCIGLCMYDPDAGIGGVAHIALPDSKLLMRDDPDATFADVATAVLAIQMVEAGADRKRIAAAMVGGAQLFPRADDESQSVDIGDLNARAVREALQNECIALVAQEVGGSIARSLELHVADGRVVVRDVGFENSELCVLGMYGANARAA